MTTWLDATNSAAFKNDLTRLLNRYSVDAACGVRDFLLAEHLHNGLQDLALMIQREKEMSVGWEVA